MLVHVNIRDTLQNEEKERMSGTRRFLPIWHFEHVWYVVIFNRFDIDRFTQTQYIFESAKRSMSQRI